MASFGVPFFMNMYNYLMQNVIICIYFKRGLDVLYFVEAIDLLTFLLGFCKGFFLFPFFQRVGDTTYSSRQKKGVVKMISLTSLNIFLFLVCL